MPSTTFEGSHIICAASKDTGQEVGMTSAEEGEERGGGGGGGGGVSRSEAFDNPHNINKMINVIVSIIGNGIHIAL